jgi:anhydro-N-acetylmuramic acid kinase
MTNNKLYIGILTGTSMDSIDCGIFNFNNNEIKLICFQENDYPADIKNSIKNNLNDLLKNYKNHELNHYLSKRYGIIINQLLEKEGITNNKISAIGMHGQTISHFKNGTKNTSIQIGSPEILNKETNIKVISNFRQDDINNGGEGAPLAPLFHDYCFKTNNKIRIIINIGGISNISLISNNKNNNVFGFDTGPGNTLIDTWANKKYKLPYDRNGKIAYSNNYSKELLDIFLNDEFFDINAPKSTSTEYFSYDWIIKKLKLSNLNHSNGEVLSTLTKFTSISILKSIKKEFNTCDEIYICGGGAFNKYILSDIANEAKIIFSEKIVVDTTDVLGFPPKCIESGLFAWLAKSKLNEDKLDYTNITGSKEPVVLGEIFSS